MPTGRPRGRLLPVATVPFPGRPGAPASGGNRHFRLSWLGSSPVASWTDRALLSALRRPPWRSRRRDPGLYRQSASSPSWSRAPWAGCSGPRAPSTSGLAVIQPALWLRRSLRVPKTARSFEPIMWKGIKRRCKAMKIL